MFGWLFLCCNNTFYTVGKLVHFSWNLATLVMKMDLLVEQNSCVCGLHPWTAVVKQFILLLTLNVFCWIGWRKNKQDKHMEEPDTIKPAFHFLLILITHCCGMISTASQPALPHFKPMIQLSLAESRLILCKPLLQICERQHSGLMCWGGEETVFLCCRILGLG